jgi:SAM-dependent methyltransferase
VTEPQRDKDAGYARGADGTWAPRVAIEHRDEEYAPSGFDLLLRMQERHFWYRGRHRFLLAALRRHLARKGASARSLHVIDLGGGCGGWVKYLCQKAALSFAELALADSSPHALALARPVIGPGVERYQIDLLRLEWAARWDIAFALDVFEHLSDDVRAAREVAKALVPGGLFFLTVPALQAFWSHNDELVGHQRRYSAADLCRLARAAGLRLLEARYFMFFLSPLVWLSRLRRPTSQAMTPEEIRAHLAKTHRLPPVFLNDLLSIVFAAEAPLGLHHQFPWGTSLLGVFQKERN